MKFSSMLRNYAPERVGTRNGWHFFARGVPLFSERCFLPLKLAFLENSGTQKTKSQIGWSRLLIRLSTNTKTQKLNFTPFFLVWNLLISISMPFLIKMRNILNPNICIKYIQSHINTSYILPEYTLAFLLLLFTKVNKIAPGF